MLDNGDKTKYWLANSLIDLMAKNSINKITVKDIVDNCGLTRQTFYRYFKDKFDLVNWYFERIADKSFKQLSNGLSLYEGLEKKFSFIRKEKNFFIQAFLIEDCNSLINYDFQCIYKFYYDIICSKTKMDESLDFMLRLYCHGSICMTMEWLQNNLDKSDKEMAYLLIDAMPNKLKKYLVTSDK